MGLRDVSLGTKLFGPAIIGIAVLLLVVVAVVWAWSRISAALGAGERAHHVVSLIHDARLSERDYLQYYAERQIERHRQASAAIAEDAARMGEDGGAIRASLEDYRRAFAGMVAAHRRLEACSAGMDAINQRTLAMVEDLSREIVKHQSSLQQEGEDLSPDEVGMQVAARDVTSVGLRLGGLLKDFRLSGDEARLDEFAALLAGPGAIASNGVVGFASTTRSAGRWKARATLVAEQLASCAVVPDQARKAQRATLGARADLERTSADMDAAAQRILERAQQEVARARGTAITAVVVIAALALAVLLAVSTLLLRTVLRPLREAIGAAEAISQGDFTRRVTVHCRDEAGRLSESLNAMAAMLRERIRQVAQQAERIGSGAVSQSEISHRLDSTATTTADQAVKVKGMASEVSAAIGSVAAATEEMHAAISVVAASSAEAAEAVSMGVHQTEAANQAVRQLSASSREIDEVIALIGSVAEQTNLLALNASIEAARAGDAGLGFSVVASEVKVLARQTAEATQRIAQRIKAIQRDSGQAGAALERITTTIHRINDIQQQVAASMEQQGAATEQISCHAQQAAASGERIVAATAGMAAAAATTRSGASATLDGSRQLSDVADGLRGVVAGFRVG